MFHLADREAPVELPLTLFSPLMATKTYEGNTFRFRNLC